MLGNHWEKLGGVDLRPLSELDTTGMRCAAAWLSPCLPDEWCAGRVAWNAWTGKFSGEPKQAEVPILQEAKGIYI